MKCKFTSRAKSSGSYNLLKTRMSDDVKPQSQGRTREGCRPHMELHVTGT